ncbi:hypothetical protein EI94DRAFT_1704286 [Lactarius quietus]|nr:hypothetical protein EI94DRAFT_1704286 [Lactarius quietus]
MAGKRLTRLLALALELYYLVCNDASSEQGSQASLWGRLGGSGPAKSIGERSATGHIEHMAHGYDSDTAPRSRAVCGAKNEMQEEHWRSFAMLELEVGACVDGARTPTLAHACKLAWLRARLLYANYDRRTPWLVLAETDTRHLDRAETCISRGDADGTVITARRLLASEGWGWWG